MNSCAIDMEFLRSELSTRVQDIYIHKWGLLELVNLITMFKARSLKQTKVKIYRVIF